MILDSDKILKKRNKSLELFLNRETVCETVCFLKYIIIILNLSSISEQAYTLCIYIYDSAYYIIDRLATMTNSNLSNR